MFCPQSTLHLDIRYNQLMVEAVDRTSDLSNVMLISLNWSYKLIHI